MLVPWRVCLYVIIPSTSSIKGSFHHRNVTLHLISFFGIVHPVVFYGAGVSPTVFPKQITTNSTQKEKEKTHCLRLPLKLICQSTRSGFEGFQSWFQWQYHHVSTFQGLLDFQSKSKLTFKKRTIFESVPKAVGFLSLVRVWNGTEPIMSTRTGKAMLQPQHPPPLYLPISLLLQSSYLLLFLLSPCLYNRFLVHMY